MMTYSASVSLMNNPKSHGLTFSRTWSIKHSSHCPLSHWVTVNAQFSEVYHSTFLLYEVTFLSKWMSVTIAHLWLFWYAWNGWTAHHMCSLVFLWARTLQRQESFLHSCTSSFTQHPFYKHNPTPTQQNALFSSPHGVQTTVCEDGLPPVGLSHRGYRAEAVLSEIFFI